MIGQGRVYIDVMDNSAILFKAIGYKNNSKNKFLVNKATDHGTVLIIHICGGENRWFPIPIIY